jgi:hypothetical protein
MDNIKFPDEIEQEQEIQNHTASLVFTPEFIHYYLDIKKIFKLSHSATLVYGFVRYYLKSASQRFYFTNLQIAEMMDVTETWISEAVSELKTKELITVEYQMKSGGGKVRFITGVYGRQVREKPNSEFGKSRSRDEATTSVKAEDNQNTINKNTLKGKNSSKDENEQSEENPKLVELQERDRKRKEHVKIPFQPHYQQGGKTIYPKKDYPKKGGIFDATNIY